MYRGGRPNRVARALNRVAAWQFRHGILTSGGRAITLEVRGRRSGQPVTFPLVLVAHDGGEYLVAMLGERAQWVRNVRADGGAATVVGRRRRPVLLTEVPVAERAPVLRRFTQLAPGGRPHVPVDHSAPPEAFAAIAADYPTFRLQDR